MTNENDLIRRGDAMKILTLHGGSQTYAYDEIAALPAVAASHATDEQIKQMVPRFLMWRLPDDFLPDGGVSFDTRFKSQHGPSGTNLLNYPQAETMVRHMLEGIAASQPADPAVKADSCQRVVVNEEQNTEQRKAFWNWLPLAYRDGHIGEEAKFTKYNMEVAHYAGWQAAIDTQPDPRDAVIDEAAAFDSADWYWRTMDPDDSGETPNDAICRGNLGQFCVCEIASSYRGPTRYGFLAPTLDPDSDDEEFVHFATHDEAMVAVKTRAAIAAAKGGAA